MVLFRGVIFVVVALSSGTAFAKDTEGGSWLNIPQVSATPKSASKVGQKENEKLLKEQDLMGSQKQDYQADVINNPKYSDYGRANAAIKMNEQAIGEGGATSKAIKQDAEAQILSEDQLGKNIAVIRQEGNSNTSTIVQTGKSNVAVQSQKGVKNSLSVTQNGDHNESHEEQVGKYNHKKKVQNGIVTETEENN